MKTPTLFAGMGSANKYPWAAPQPADANSWRWLVASASRSGIGLLIPSDYNGYRCLAASNRYRWRGGQIALCARFPPKMHGGSGTLRCWICSVTYRNNKLRGWGRGPLKCNSWVEWASFSSFRFP